MTDSALAVPGIRGAKRYPPASAPTPATTSTRSWPTAPRTSQANAVKAIAAATKANTPVPKMNPAAVIPGRAGRGSSISGRTSSAATTASSAPCSRTHERLVTIHCSRSLRYFNSAWAADDNCRPHEGHRRSALSPALATSAEQRGQGITVVGTSP